MVVMTLLAGIVAALVTARRPTRPPAGDVWQTAAVSSLREAEELFDALENRGFVEREVVEIGNSCIAVRWR